MTTPATFSLSSVHQKVQQRLRIKYVYAKQLTDAAIEELHDSTDADLINNESIVVEKVVQKFQRLNAKDQNEMMMKDGETDDSENEPEWKRKARIAAEKREAEWKAQNPPPISSDHDTAQQEQPLEPGTMKETTTTTSTSSTTTTIKKHINEGSPTKKDGKWKQIKKEEMPPNYEKENPDKVRHVKCLCTIL